MTALQRAIDIVGSGAELARRIGLTAWAVNKWNPHKVPQNRCLAIEKATDGQVKAEELRPDINWQYVRQNQKK
ncbi:transcriptional regulator [Moraxella bovoculi]|uniref:transcriptional regulator n=1 Tax=Moraxella bovoculi TaxID=386891 RepID=UPI000624CFA7|nr:Cro/CI family transcriptional regulator [Moraxella bovoculi]AKG12270.1 Cro/Cl family transcriptional regulator [Moraxella bovoculi]AKG14241.1 Cro/Cl family transcriptional regulator [Moraxella bovoculi]